MSEGSSAYNGLAVGLHGEHEITQVDGTLDMLTLTGSASATGDFFICQDSSGTELFQIQEDGRTRINCTADGQNALDVYYTLTASNANQCYGQTIYFESGGFSSNGGRHAVLNLWYANDTNGVNSSNAHSYINFAAPGAAYEPYALMTILNATTDASLFVTTNQSASRGLRVWVNNVQYYILLGATS
jgi:hypothetical protein